MQPIAYFVFQRKTVFIPFRHLYPECYVLIRPHTVLHPLKCMKDSCPVNRNCGEILAKKVNYFFNEVEPAASLMIAYFKYEDTKSLRAGVFTKDLDEPRLCTLNPWAFDKFQKEGIVRQWMPTFTFTNIAGSPSPAIIPVESLVRK